MKIAKWYNNKDIRIEEVPTPTPGPREMLIKVVCCGICGSDIVEWYRLPRAPLVQGHEIGAEVVAVGDEVGDYKPGDRVFVMPKVPCGECRYCRDGHFPVCGEVKGRLPGGFAEYILVPEQLVELGTFRLPESISYEQSTFIEPLACAVRAQRLAGVASGQTLLVLGCGMSGLLHTKLAREKGCTIFATDIDAKKLEFAKAAGADVTIDAGDDVAGRLVSENGRKADAVILCAGAPAAVEQAWQCVDKGGVIVFFAVPGPGQEIMIPVNDFWTKEIRVLTSYYCGPPDILDAMKLIETGTVTVDDLVTHRFPLEEIEEGFRLVLEGRESVKVIIRPND